MISYVEADALHCPYLLPILTAILTAILTPILTPIFTPIFTPILRKLEDPSPDYGNHAR